MTLTTWFQLISIVSTSITIIALIGKFFIVTPLKHYIREQTHSIQPNANGGKSLPDVAKNVIQIKATLEGLTHQVDKIETRVDSHIDQHARGEV